MKVDLTDLSRAYQNHLKEPGPERDETCPSPERLAACVFSRAGRKERTAILEHAAECPDCARALKCALGMSDEADAFIARLKALGRTKPADEPPARGVFARLMPKPALAVAGAFFVVAAIGFGVLRLMRSSGVRGGESHAVRMIAPLDSAVRLDDVRFRWEAAEGADHYFVEVFDSAFRLLWRSGSLKAAETDLPSEARREVVPGGTYFWLVTAVTRDARQLRSGLAEFSVKK